MLARLTTVNDACLEKIKTAVLSGHREFGMELLPEVSKSKIPVFYLSDTEHCPDIKSVVFSPLIKSVCGVTTGQLSFFSLLDKFTGQDTVCIVATDGNRLPDLLVEYQHHSPTELLPPLIIINCPLNTDGPVLNRAEPAQNDGLMPITVFNLGEVTANTLLQAILSSAANVRLRYRLMHAQTDYDVVMESISEGVLNVDYEGKLLSCNNVAARMFEFDREAAGQISLQDLIAEPDKKVIIDFFSNGITGASAKNPNLLYRSEITGVRASGDCFPLVLTISFSGFKGIKAYTCVARDVTQSKITDEELKLATTAFSTHTAILITDSRASILRVNPAFTSITGYEAHEVIGKNPKLLQSGFHDRKFYRDLWLSLSKSGKWEGEIWNKRKTGEVYPEYQTITAVKNEAGKVTHYVGTFQDITERKHDQALIERQAYYDALTNLPNRRMLLDRLNQEIAAARRRKTYGALLFVDLDYFKNLNDTMGHAVGDQLLQQMASRMSNQVRKEDTVARLGGDEFVILLSNLGSRKKPALSITSTIAEKIRHAISRAYSIEGEHYHFTSSIGVALFPSTELANEKAGSVLRQADIAMYSAKSQGRNTICYYQSSMQVPGITRRHNTSLQNIKLKS